MTAAREPGSPLLLIADTAAPEQFDGAEALARRVHQLRQGGGLDFTVGHASTGGPAFPGVLIWRSAPRTYLAFAAGRGADTPTALVAALSRTRAAVAA
jgi:hypothetical protein